MVRFLKIALAAIALGSAISANSELLRAETTETASLAPKQSPHSDKAFTQLGLASYYPARGRSASGAPKPADGMTAAHRHLPFGSRVKVKHLKSGREVVVVIDDRGPFLKGRIIDISNKAAHALGMTRQGVAKVRITLID